MTQEKDITALATRIRFPDLLLTGGPLESDASFRVRILPLAEEHAEGNVVAVQVATGQYLDALGLVHGLVRVGLKSR